MPGVTRRAVVVGSATTALALSSCGVVGGGSSAAEPTYVAPSTSTTAPSPSSGPRGTVPTRIPLGSEILADAKNQARWGKSVTITATLPPRPGEEDVGPMTVVSKGDVGGGGTDVTVSLGDGSSIQQRTMGDWNVYLKLERPAKGVPGDVEIGLQDRIESGSPLVQNEGRWVRVYGDPPLPLRPYDILNRNVRAGKLERADMRYAVTDVRELDGEQVYGVLVRPASDSAKADNVVRTFWVSPWTEETGYRFLRLEAGAYPRKNTLVFSGWGSTPQSFPKPPGAVSVKDSTSVFTG